MPKTQYTKTALKEAIAGKLQRHFACEVEDATKDQVYEACALVVRDALTEHMIETQNEVERDGERQVHYLCMEFLVGRSLRNNAYNLGMLDALTAALKDMGFEMADIFEEEADPGLGNGGLGRLAACYMDGMATDGVRGTGYSIRYEHGIFKQKIVEGQQVELPDSWLSTGEVWQIPAMDETREVKIGGTVDTYFDDNGKLIVNYHDYTPVLAVPYDMPIVGYGNHVVNTLRVWDAKPITDFKLDEFDRGNYHKAVEQENLAKLIELADAGTINSSVAKEVFDHVFEKNVDPEKYVEEHGLKTVNDEGALIEVLEKVIADNPQAVVDYKGGKEKALGALVGQTMKAMKGKANPGLVNQKLREMLK